MTINTAQALSAQTMPTLHQQKTTVKNTADVRHIIAKTQAGAIRSVNPAINSTIIDMGQLQYAENDFIKMEFTAGTIGFREEDLTDMPHNLMVSLKSFAGHDVLNAPSGQQRNITEMANFIEQKLTSINNADVSELQRAAMREAWEGGFANAFRNYLMQDFFSSVAQGSMDAANQFVRNIMGNVEMGGFSANVQSLMLRGLGELIHFEGRTHLQTPHRDVSASGRQAERENFQTQIAKMQTDINEQINNLLNR